MESELHFCLGVFYHINSLSLIRSTFVSNEYGVLELRAIKVVGSREFMTIEVCVSDVGLFT